MPDFEADIASGLAAETSLKLLGSQRELGHGELPQLYAYPVGSTRVRANFITSLDGGATVEGLSGALAGPGDRAVFVVLRELADVIVVGAGTVRSEGYSGAQLSVGQRQQRQARGQSEMPPLAIVTKSGRLDRDLAVFTRTEVPPFILTCTAAADDIRRHLVGLGAEVIDCSGADPKEVDVAAIVAALAARGLHRVLTEGGPTLLGAFIEADLLDELCLTIAPLLVGGQAKRIAAGPGQVATRMRCEHVLADDAGYLYTRYVKD
ncbi:MAG: pyrimidine reductase family protein [Mycobacteriaceae bacterium]|nr:pyrimidine reductase family protein [Mycobacteriaceae bacterium]